MVIFTIVTIGIMITITITIIIIHITIAFTVIISMCISEVAIGIMSTRIVITALKYMDRSCAARPVSVCNFVCV